MASINKDLADGPAGLGERTTLLALLGGALRDLVVILRRPQFYAGLFVLILGIQMTFFSQSYLHGYVLETQKLPYLSDLILDNLPYINVDFLYDYFCLLSLVIFAIHVVHRRQMRAVPYFLLLCGIFHLVRGVFIVLKPLEHQQMFDGTESVFDGFSKYELGVYPSGHTGISYMYFLLVVGREYRALLLACLLIVIGSLFLSRGHYSIDVLSGLFFAYAIKSFGDRHLRRRMIPEF